VCIIQHESPQQRIARKRRKFQRTRIVQIHPKENKKEEENSSSWKVAEIGKEFVGRRYSETKLTENVESNT
jgi:hypothetical protein